MYKIYSKKLKLLRLNPRLGLVSRSTQSIDYPYKAKATWFFVNQNNHNNNDSFFYY